MTLPTITPNTIDLSPGDELILRFRTWQDYENLLNQRADQAGLRIRYNALTQEIRIMAPLPKHGNMADLLADLVKTLLRTQKQDWQGFTPITLKRAGQQGVEPDYCFYIKNRDRILGKERLNLEHDPPPDLVLEVDLTATTKPEDYLAIALLNCGYIGKINCSICQFQAQQIQECQTSDHFPEYNIKALMPQYLDRGWQAGSSVALREFDQFLDNKLNSSS